MTVSRGSVGIHARMVGLVLGAVTAVAASPLAPPWAGATWGATWGAASAQQVDGGEIETAEIVALVMSTGLGGARADAIQASLQVIGAQTLRAIDPNNAELRSLLRRFADAAADTDVALVYIDAPVLALEGRIFVLPAETGLRRASDLLTRGLPLSAFARAAAAAGSGGAVLVAVGAP
ncbi:MAG: hypothetical protein AAF899_14280, partial [Pseudomonadota bacterium]